MTQKDFSLRQVFADLAKDTSWPNGGMCWEHKLDKARLALMVMEERALQYECEEQASINYTIKAFNITPSDYSNVLKRVEEAG